MRDNGDISSGAPPNSEKSTVSQNHKRGISEYLHLPRSPPPPSRRLSFSKRRTSFHSPREIPLPSSPLTCSSQLASYPFPNTASNTISHSLSSKGDDFTGLDHSSTGSLHLSASRPLPSIPYTPPRISSPDSSLDMKTSDSPGSKQPDTPHPSSATNHHQFSPHGMESQSTAAPIFPFSRPYSSPDGHLSMQPTNCHDVSSTMGLPQTPYNLLPRMDGPVAVASPSPGDSQSPSEVSEQTLPLRPQTNAVPNDLQIQRLPLSNVPRFSQAGWPCAPIPLSPSPPEDQMQPPASSSNEGLYPAPEAPVILTPPTQAERCGEDATKRAPYDSFLCHGPPPDTWIVVETSSSEYRLVVRLPGFRRDAITIATRRSRILHVVADSWEPEGGHFERRVLFGYDADLAQVRAEFDGQILRIIVPRRIPAVSWYNHQ
ncbi:uncharacterized protein EDB93DRAFT_1144072 [Suillus bovinus]|uniref:uncharacterized protein n=1 Tax=Suillus bovinus TaxID=48563 RepID=UPI001B87D2B0|nr:uncharacterized protein EDB93DRAFT_1144072 [Suillus bovinus]KAG2148646.1 hypothetical protein EDB93DRAFT_1144072 [Suillus bovinus]